MKPLSYFFSLFSIVIGSWVGVFHGVWIAAPALMVSALVALDASVTAIVEAIDQSTKERK